MGFRDKITGLWSRSELAGELESAKIELARAKQELQAAQQQCELFENEGEALRYELNAAEHRINGLTAALHAAQPPLHTAEELQRFYEAASPDLDPEGFKLYNAAVEQTGFQLSAAFPYEDALGGFEEADGNQLLSYLLADQFGTVKWEIVPGTCYERASSWEVNTSDPKYQAFQKEIYESALRSMGFGALLPEYPHKNRDTKEWRDACER